MIRLTRFLETTTTVLGPNRIEAIAGTSKKARDGHIVEMSGMDTSAFLRSGTILWSHRQDWPVGVPVAGRVDSAGNLRLTVDFAPDGASELADEIRNLVKTGIVRNMSIGFDAIEAEPLDPKNPRGGMRVTRSELLECSFVSVPADTGAVVTARSERTGKVLSGANAGALREAHDLAERCRATIADVLGGAGAGGAAAEAERDHRRRQIELIRLRGKAFLHGCDARFELRQRQLEVLKRSPGSRAAAELDQERRRREV